MVGGYVLAPRSLVEFLETCVFDSETATVTHDLPSEVVKDLTEIVQRTNKPLLLEFNTRYGNSIIQFRTIATLTETVANLAIFTYSFQGFSSLSAESLTLVCGAISIRVRSGTVTIRNQHL